MFINFFAELKMWIEKYDFMVKIILKWWDDQTVLIIFILYNKSKIS